MKLNTQIFPTALITGVAAVSGFLLAQDLIEEPASLAIETDTRPIERTSGPAANSYAPMLEKVTPAVVSVHTSEVVRYARSNQDDLLRRFFGMPQQRNQNQPQAEERLVPQGVGSGVIVSADGYILTNNHVVQDQRGGDADEILIRLPDDREYTAELIGRDPKTDVAVLKIDAEELPFIPVADSEQIKVGDIVFAVGNPLGIGLTVSSGIVSATGRSIGIYGREGYEDFIQTDAAINRGNSGGALVDIEGRLIGINSAIVSPSGGNIGIGFAIPSNLALNVSEQLTESGEVKRGLIGVRIDHLTPQLAEAMGLGDQKGVLIQQVEEGFPAEKAGITHGDVVTHIDGQAVTTPNDLRIAVSQKSPGDELEVILIRDEETKTVNVKIADPDEVASATGKFLDGVKAAKIDNEARSEYDLPRNIRGIVITEVDPTSRFSRYFEPGMVILEVNRRKFNNLGEARKLLRDGRQNLLYIYHNGNTRYFALSQ
ncbi:MAG: Do family serine endopeptidase [Verrucomicrobiota bacterium]